MTFEEGVNTVWILILVLALVAVMIGFFIFFRPGVQGGWFTSLANTLKWLITPPV